MQLVVMLVAAPVVEDCFEEIAVVVVVEPGFLF